MIRFFLFIFGLIAGFISAIFILPIPGKTFFNKMSRLPNSVKTLIDDGIDLGVSFWKLMIGLTEDLGLRLRESLEIAKVKTEKVQEKLETNRRREHHIKEILANAEDDISEEVIEKISVQ